jgi:hypothetical protein
MLKNFSFPQLPLKFLLSLYTVLLALYAVFSYSLTDPNLVLSNWKPYWNFQLWMWETFFHNAVLLSWVYGGLLALLFVVYLWIIQVLQRSSLEYQRDWKVYCLVYGLVVLPLFFSYNALSHDVFNYIFNAKMVAVFNANPHVKVALDYAYDPWTRFMHNTHTPAPYWYGWTALSLIPFYIGMGKFMVTWLAFRAWSVLSIVLLYFGIQYAAKIFTGEKLQAHQLALVFFNPLLIIEIISNAHNDLWMVVPAVIATAIITSLDPQQRPQPKKLLTAVALLGVSISIKLATAALLPLLIVLVLEKNSIFAIADIVAGYLPFFKKLPAKLLHSLDSYIAQYVPYAAAALLFIPLLTLRSQQFHPWYWTWVLVWVPFIKVQWLKTVVILFSVSSMFRYLPWLWTGGFDGNVLLYQKLITWLPILIYLIWRFFPSAVVGTSNTGVKKIN